MSTIDRQETMTLDEVIEHLSEIRQNRGGSVLTNVCGISRDRIFVPDQYQPVVHFERIPVPGLDPEADEKEIQEADGEETV